MTFTKAQRIKGLKKQAENLGLKLVGDEQVLDGEPETTGTPVFKREEDSF